MSTVAIWWIRRDLRLSDSPALNEALAHADRVIPLFVLDPILLDRERTALQRVAFLIEGLRLLDAELRARGNSLLARHGDPSEILPHVVRESGASAVYAVEDYSPYARSRDRSVGSLAPLHLLPGLTVHAPELVKKSDGTPFTVFTPFARRWKGLPPPSSADLLPRPSHIPAADAFTSHPLPTSPRLTSPFPPGETEAQRRLRDFVGGKDARVYDYAENRNYLGLDATSHLSPYLRFGMISARQAVVSVVRAMGNAPTPEARKGAEAWLDELIWREFYIAILYHFPHVLRCSFRSQYDHIAWRNDAGEFAAWCEGKTGYPVVDAAMRQLRATGWMHNRARMITASFLVKDLLIDWRWGERWFIRHLLDGDPASNNGGWQWTAGTGTDAAPYFRVFNPTLQGKKFDPLGDYIRRWLPELALVPASYIHEPWKMPKEAQTESGCHIGREYPAPVVDHRFARQRALDAYKAATSAS